MYAIKKIKKNDELTFNYYSFTENFDEHQKSICLCGK